MLTLMSEGVIVALYLMMISEGLAKRAMWLAALCLTCIAGIIAYMTVKGWI